MENFKQTILEKKIQDGDRGTKSIFKEKNFWTTTSWSAIFSGVIVTTVSQMLLSLLGVGIGLATINPVRELNDPMDGLGIGSIIWWSVTMLVSLFLGGWVTGRMYTGKVNEERTIHGLLTWCTFTVFSFFMLTTSIGALVSGAGSVMRTTLMTGASVAGNNKLNISGLMNDARNVLMQQPIYNQSGQQEQEETRTTNNQMGRQPSFGNNQLFLNNVENFFQGDDEIRTDKSREALVNSLVNQTGMTRSNANDRVDEWITSYENLKAEAKIKADKAANASSIASFVFFFALLVGALVTIWGARMAPIVKE